MKHIWSILCQNSSVDDRTKLLSIFNCVEELSLVFKKDKMPKDNNLVIPISFQLINFWIADNKEKRNTLEIKLEILDPLKELLGTFNKAFEIADKAPRFRSIISINGIKVTKEGRYTLRVLQKEDSGDKFKTVAELPLDIKINYK
jgi:hypothetical protein